ncbi:MAG TPA: superoxide dismutase [Prolixibacteraceae bacterium]|nr:superoxide dismutase [Prolixibacteraceae bacterium]
MKRIQAFNIFSIAMVLFLMVSFNSEAQNSKNVHEFPELSYELNALEPHIDAETMNLHYNKHHKGYYNKFMKAIEGTKLETTPINEIFYNISDYNKNVRNNGGGFYNHKLYWENLTPDQGDIPAGLKSELKKSFGSIDAFKKAYSAAAGSVFGSGWAWLVYQADGDLVITSTSNQDNPLMDVAEVRGMPLLTIDVWEHAYYLNYQNKRGDYISSFWKVVNWDVVAQRLKHAEANCKK